MADRYWLLTWTTYGSWLPGDPRGSVTTVRRGHETRHRHNSPGAPIDPSMPGLQSAAKNGLRSEPRRLDATQAATLLEQIQQTCLHRQWQLLAMAVMANHVHVVVGVPGDPDPSHILRDLKAYGSRALNSAPSSAANSGSWWTESGSKRKLPDEAAILTAARYVRDQEHILAVWIAPNLELASSHRAGERGA